MRAVWCRRAFRVQASSKCLIQKSPCRSADGNFCASGTHVPLCTLRSGSRNHHFRHGLPLFDSDTAQTAQ
ncbi:hypothetical protein F9K94_00575 [Brucella tritici]|uniref:Uncharacterized protein n=1 Tax=Brucella tritici TaxID=94626 RepID=A0A7V8B4V6_9HYPH|nr:hypothetical protein F9K94_00575 [Brucella tritici]